MSGLPTGLLPARPKDAHKGDAGRVFLVAGSTGLSGAAALCTMGALRVGAGLVTLGLPKSLHDPMVEKLTEAMLKVLPETKEGSLSQQALPEIISTAERMDAIGIGPGLSQHPQTTTLVQQVLPKIVKPLVVDADGLNALAEDLDVLRRRTLPCILTPHPGEMGRLIRLSADDVQRDRQRIAVEFAKKYRVVVVLKGHGTVVARYDGEAFVNETGNPGMASGGFGDVLTGMIAGLLGQGLELFDAARLGVYLHGLAGDMAARERGEIGLLASDLLDRIPLAIRQYQSSPV
ncbi:MAG: NAD(P)H-hydrate dehydratase [Candidatus Omnitrophica bacterium CG11_big_fil_rev_8_21_14_0_20_63_9]|nr:MAG: NAD(P)H-hydrate dehydratase [Candidatus Omnitrophica bacterium CG11_big_fil_rev_8_21_14_0_20_63_9]